MDDLYETLIISLTLAITVVIIGLIVAFPIMWLWNFVMPAVFGLTRITFWQAFALYALSNIFFKSDRSSKD